MVCFGPYIGPLRALPRGLLALSLPPQHDGVNQRLWRRACNVPECSYELVKVGVDSRAAHQLDPRLGLAPVRHALVDLLLRLADEGVEQMVQRILANRLELVRMLVPRLRAGMAMALTRRPPAWRPLWLAARGAAVTACWHGGRGARVSVQRVTSRAIRGKGVGYGLLRHDGSIEGGARRGNGLGAQRAGRG
jgi:hypothetical protein